MTAVPEQTTTKRMADIAPIVVRVAVALVFLWFGYTQLQNPDIWIGFLPSWIMFVPLAPKTLVMLNGSFEIIFGLMLLIGVQVRVAALLLAAHLLGIAVTAGGDIGIRDFGLAMATLGVFFYGVDKLCYSRRLFTKKPQDTDSH